MSISFLNGKTKEGIVGHNSVISFSTRGRVPSSTWMLMWTNLKPLDQVGSLFYLFFFLIFASMHGFLISPPNIVKTQERERYRELEKERETNSHPHSHTHTHSFSLFFSSPMAWLAHSHSSSSSLPNTQLPTSSSFDFFFTIHFPNTNNLLY